MSKNADEGHGSMTVSGYQEQESTESLLYVLITITYMPGDFVE